MLNHNFRFTNDKLRRVFAILKDFNDNKLEDQKFCCIIFVKERFMTQVIYHILKVSVFFTFFYYSIFSLYIPDTI